MAADMDDVLSITPSDSEMSDFSGFDINDIGANIEISSKKKGNKMVKIGKGKTPMPKKVLHLSKTKSVVVKPAKACVKGDTSSNNVVDGPSTSKVGRGTEKGLTGQNLVDLNNLTPENIAVLRELLGINPNHDEEPGDNTAFTDNDFWDREHNVTFANSEKSRTPLGVISNISMTGNLNEALFDTGYDENVVASSMHENDPNLIEEAWELPKLKIPQYGENISESLAQLINAATTSQCITDQIVDKYKIPQNCNKMGPPKINPEIWGELNKRVQSADKNFRDTQLLVAAAIMPIVKLAALVKAQMSITPEIKACISDAITLMGQVQYNISLRRRYMLRPHLKKKYSSLCNLNTPISSLLFGDDVAQEIKKCETGLRLRRDDNAFNFNARGRGYSRGCPTRPYRGRGLNRYQPYNNPNRYGHMNTDRGRSKMPMSQQRDIQHN